MRRGNNNSEGTYDISKQELLGQYLNGRHSGGRHGWRSRQRYRAESPIRIRGMGGGRPRLRQYPLQPAQADQYGECGQALVGLFILARIAALQRVVANRRWQYALRFDLVGSQIRLRA